MPRIKKANPMQNPNTPDYINYMYPPSGSTPDYIKQKNSPDPFRPYSYSTGMNNNAQWNADDYIRGQSAPLKQPKQPKPRKQTPASGYIKQDAWTPDYITNRVNGSMESSMMAQLMNLYNQLPDSELMSLYNQMSGAASNAALQVANAQPGRIDEFLDNADPNRRRITRDLYNATYNREPFRGGLEMTPGYISSNFSNPVSKRKSPTKRNKY